MRQFVIDWVKSLRSGKHKQGTNTLEQITKDGSSEYCCLGVLMHISKMPYKPRPFKTAMLPKHFSDERDDTVLTFEAVQKFGIPDDGNFWIKNGTDKCPHYDEILQVTDRFGEKLLDEDSTTTELTTLNDKVGLTFNQIADVIEWVERNDRWVKPS